MITVRLLGTSASIPTSERNLPGTLLEFEDDKILFDCGEGTQKQLMVGALHFMRINRIFITHWHADHFAGLLGLIQTMALEGRKTKLEIFGPKETKKFVNRLLGVGYYARGFDIDVFDLTHGQKVEGDGYTITAFDVEHRVPTLGYAFQENDRLNVDMKKAKKLGLGEGPAVGRLKSGKAVVVDGKKIQPEDIITRTPGNKIVITGDTSPCENVVKFAHGADLLIHDSTYGKERKQRAPFVKHSTSIGAAKIAKAAGVKKLVLYHISRRYQKSGGVLKPSKELLKEAKTVFKNTVLGEDMMEIVVK